MPCADWEYIRIWLFNAGPPPNVDFARFSFHVPTTGSASIPAAMTALPMVRSAPRNTLERTFFTIVPLWLLLRLLVVSLCPRTNCGPIQRAPACTRGFRLARVWAPANLARTARVLRHGIALN